MADGGGVRPKAGAMWWAGFFYRNANLFSIKRYRGSSTELPEHLKSSKAPADSAMYTTFGLDHVVGHPQESVVLEESAKVYGITKPLRNQA